MSRHRQTCALWLLGCTSAGCDQQHLLLGSLPAIDTAAMDAAAQDAVADSAQLDAGPQLSLVDAEVLDAAALRDAEPDSAGPLQLEFVANGITGVTRLKGCSGTCIEVQLKPSGGRPPYAVQWQDGSRAMTRQLCAVEAESHTVSLRDQDSPPLSDDAGLSERFSFTVSLSVEPRDCSIIDAGSSLDWFACFLPTRVQGSCAGMASAAREEIFALPEHLPSAAEPSVQLYLGSLLLLPETLQVLTSEDGCATGSAPYLTLQPGLFTQVITACGPQLDARYLHVWTMNASTSVGSLEVCQSCR